MFLEIATRSQPLLNRPSTLQLGVRDYQRVLRGVLGGMPLRDALRDTLRVAWVELKEPQGEHV